ncbi:UNVERIFIED_CONTAM: hypothetical protein Sradi_5557800 [Sesamum radiatum]|uniref:Uncharacterized protein n=1 Tax=Sesamum radiatum TaxID=300843 RepID=A0AAW2LGF4_SESRA
MDTLDMIFEAEHTIEQTDTMYSICSSFIGTKKSMLHVGMQSLILICDRNIIIILSSSKRGYGETYVKDHTNVEILLRMFVKLWRDTREFVTKTINCDKYANYQSSENHGQMGLHIVETQSTHFCRIKAFKSPVYHLGTAAASFMVGTLQQLLVKF